MFILPWLFHVSELLASRWTGYIPLLSSRLDRLVRRASFQPSQGHLLQDSHVAVILPCTSLARLLPVNMLSVLMSAVAIITRRCLPRRMAGLLSWRYVLFLDIHHECTHRPIL